MRVICPHCQTIYQLQGLEADAVLVCHRCGTEFGLGDKPEDAQDIDSAAITDAQTPDMFAGLPVETAESANAESPAGSSDDMFSEQSMPFSEQSMPEEAVDLPAEEPAAESIGQSDYPEPEDIPLYEPATDAEPAPDVEPANDVAPADDVEPTSTEEQADTLEPVIIPLRDEWPQAAASDAEKIIISDPAEDEPREDSDNSIDIPSDDTPSDHVPSDDTPSGPPPRGKARIMPWLMSIVLLIAGTGFWINHEAWLNDPWLRSVLINAGITMQIRDKDWQVDPESVSAVWIERKAGETVLVITGEVGNQLQTDLPPPLIHVTLYARDNPDEMIAERDEIITRPPLMQTIRKAPYTAPPRDNAPITALAKRGFVLVLENLPQNAGNFTLQAKAR